MKSFKNRFSCINVLSTIALDLVSAPASQTYTERIFQCLWQLYCEEEEQNLHIAWSSSVSESQYEDRIAVTM